MLIVNVIDGQRRAPQNICDRAADPRFLINTDPDSFKIEWSLTIKDGIGQARYFF